MSSPDEAKGASRRDEHRKLVFQRSQELKKCKTKQQKEAIEAKYKLLEFDLLDKRISSSSPVVECTVPKVAESFYSDQTKEISRAQKKKASKNEREKIARDAHLADFGDGSVEQALNEEELNAIIGKLPAGYALLQIPADGDCMFSSIAYQVGITVVEVRDQIASFIALHKSDFEWFIEEDFASYVESVRESAWGSDIEVEAAARIFERPVKIFAKNQTHLFGESFTGESPMLLSFHERQYSSPHYNAVVRREV